jgi:hypothetical protein
VPRVTRIISRPNDTVAAATPVGQYTISSDDSAVRLHEKLAAVAAAVGICNVTSRRRAFLPHRFLPDEAAVGIVQQSAGQTRWIADRIQLAPLRQPRLRLHHFDSGDEVRTGGCEGACLRTVCHRERSRQRRAQQQCQHDRAGEHL